MAKGRRVKIYKVVRRTSTNTLISSFVGRCSSFGATRLCRVYSTEEDTTPVDGLPLYAFTGDEKGMKAAISYLVGGGDEIWEAEGILKKKRFMCPGHIIWVGSIRRLLSFLKREAGMESYKLSCSWYSQVVFCSRIRLIRKVEIPSTKIP